MLFSYNLTFAQNATFEADTSGFTFYKSQGDSTIPIYVSQMSWKINGQDMYFGSEKVQIPINGETLDTILFKQGPNRRIDTIVFNASEPGNYSLIFNDCCGGFNINPKGSRNYLKGNLILDLINADSSAQYFATLGETGMTINPYKNDTLIVGCRSAMSPNIYPIALYKYSPCKDSICDLSVCVLESNIEPNYEFGITILETYFAFLWMPLKNEPTVITYDIQHKKIISIE
jgi:hypothetical protein